MKLIRLFQKECTTTVKILNIVICTLLYLFMTFVLRYLSGDDVESRLIPMLDNFVIRGIITQLQLILSVYIVLRLNREGFITAVLLNGFTCVVAIMYMVRTGSPTSMPGVIASLAVIVVITTVYQYKKQVFVYLEMIEHQKQDLVRSQELLYRMAYFDSLTGLPNQVSFFDQLEEKMIHARASGSLLAVVCLDLDSFKTIKDTLGYAAGDEVLIQITKRLKKVDDKKYYVTRFGGDEFFLLVEGDRNREELDASLKVVMGLFEEPMIIRGIEFFISASAGVAVFPEDGDDVDILVKNADLSMFESKTNGKNQYTYCTKELKETTNRNMLLTNGLYRALERKELFLHYQPQVSVKTKKIVGFEALLRWKHDEYGTVSPGEFIPLAEQTGLIKPIGLWVFRKACEQCKSCSIPNKESIHISVNVSVEQLQDASVVSHFVEIARETGMDPGRIEIEVTESIAFSKDFDVISKLRELKAAGFMIAIDDFGKEYSSLNRISAFPVDLIKIDMDFVHGISSGNKKACAIVKTIIQFAKNLGVRVLAEGVETIEQFEFLKREECDEVQGYLFYRGMPVEEAMAHMLAQSKSEEQ